MYKTGLLLSLMFFVSVGLYGQITQEELDRARKEADEDPGRKEYYNALLDSVRSQNAVISFEERFFVLEAERITFRRGNLRLVSPSTNFISMDKDKATVQIAFDGAPPGPNGLGGITVDGRVSNIKTKTDRKGNMRMSMSVIGTGISAQIEIELPKGRHTATATVIPNFSSNRFILSGSLLPPSQSRVFKGTAF